MKGDFFFVFHKSGFNRATRLINPSRLLDSPVANVSEERCHHRSFGDGAKKGQRVHSIFSRLSKKQSDEGPWKVMEIMNPLLNKLSCVSNLILFYLQAILSSVPAPFLRILKSPEISSFLQNKYNRKLIISPGQKKNSHDNTTLIKEPIGMEIGGSFLIT